MPYIAMALYSYGLCSYGLYSYGLYSYGLYGSFIYGIHQSFNAWVKLWTADKDKDRVEYNEALAKWSILQLRYRTTQTRNTKRRFVAWDPWAVAISPRP